MTLTANTKWEKVRLGTILTDISDGTHYTPRYVETGMPFLSVKNVRDDGFDLSDIKYISKEEYQQLSKRAKPEVGDILYTKVGTTGIAKVIDINPDFSIFVSLALLKFDKSLIDPYFLEQQLNSPFVKKQAQERTRGTGNKNLVLKDIKEITLNFPLINGKIDLRTQQSLREKVNITQVIRKENKQLLSKIDLLKSALFHKTYTTEYQAVPLSQLCKIIKGSSPTLKTNPGEYPLVVTAEERKTSDSFQFDNEAVCIPLVSSTGHGHASIKRLHYQNGKFALANIMAALIPLEPNILLAKYLYYFLSYYKDTLLVSLMRGGANVTIPIKELDRVLIVLPPLNIQKVLVSLLDKANKIEESVVKRQVLSNLLFESTTEYLFNIN